MKTLNLAIIVTISLGLFALNHVAFAEDTASFAKIDAVYHPSTNVLEITGIVYKTFSQDYALTVFNPQGQLIAVSQLQLSQDDTFTQNIETSSPLWSESGNYAVKVASGPQMLADKSFYFPGMSCCIQNSQGIQAGLSETTNVIDSPLEQFKSGVIPKDVKCNGDLQLIIKAEDGSPACVKPETAQKLIERGWARHATGIDALGIPTIGLYNVTVSPQPLILGISFFVTAEVTNNQNTPITYYGGCTSPLSVSFDNIQTHSDGLHCLAISKYVLGPHEQVTVQSEKINTEYNKTAPEYANAEVKFSYEDNGTHASWFTGAQFPVQRAVKLNCTEPFGIQMEKINKSVNVAKAIALAYISPEFLSKVKQYGDVSYMGFYNDLYPAQSCGSYWKGVEVMFSANTGNGTTNIRVSEDIDLIRVLKVEDFQVFAN